MPLENPRICLGLIKAESRADSGPPNPSHLLGTMGDSKAREETTCLQRCYLRFNVKDLAYKLAQQMIVSTLPPGKILNSSW